MAGWIIIAYILYFIYIFALMVDWDYITTNESVIWLTIIIMTLGIFILLFVIGLNYSGYNLVNNGTLVFLLLVFIVVVAFLAYYQYSTSTKNKSSIKSKFEHKRLTNLTYEYGADSQEIGNRLRVGLTNEYFSREFPIPLQDIWANLMSHDITQNKVNEILTEILGTNWNDSIDVSYNLLWYLCISSDPYRIGLNKREIGYLIRADITELNELIGDTYTGARDRASLIFTLLSGQIIPTVELSERYQRIKQYKPNVVYNLAFGTGMIDHNQGTYNIHGPYTYLSLRQPSVIEQLISSIDDSQNIDDMIHELGIGPINNFRTMTKDEKIVYLQGDLSLYQNVFSRAEGTAHPPSLKGLNRETILDIMSIYTNTELIEAYEPRGRWNSRYELMRLICSDILDSSKWSIHSVDNCNNDETINIITTELHGEVNKSDPEDPTLSYGIHKNYRCYQASELEASFDNYDGVFLFRVPDWSASEIDPITGNPLIKEFSTDSIKQLKSLLEREQYNYQVNGLLAKINTGLEFMKSIQMQIRHLKQQLDAFTFEQKQIVELYLAWMFTYSMWMRFWKGPGHPWPLSKVNVRRTSDRNRAQRSSPEERDEHIFIQEGVRSAIVEMYETDPILSKWIETLPTIYYDFSTEEASCASHNIKNILDKIALGEYCMGFGSDTILKTAYYYITFLLERPQGRLFDEFIENKFPRLQDLEYNTVTNQLNSMTTISFRTQVLNNRLQILNQPIPKQPAFDTSTYQNNIHVD